jgi:hypothetical protein
MAEYALRGAKKRYLIKKYTSFAMVLQNFFAGNLHP